MTTSPFKLFTASAPAALVCFLSINLLLSSSAAFAPSFVSRQSTRLCVGANYQEPQKVIATSTTMPTRSQFRSASKPRSLYDILGANIDDSPAELKRKYVVLAKKSHPDAVGAGSSSRHPTIDFGDVAAAYSVLSDPKQRLKYDRQLAAENWAETICYLLGGLVEFFVLFFQHVLLPLTNCQSFEKVGQNDDATVSAHTDDWWFASTNDDYDRFYAAASS